MIENPANLISTPNRVSDFTSKDYFELYFTEMIAAIPNRLFRPSSLPTEWRAAMLAACPATGHLMYLPPGRYICWVVIDDPLVQEAWVRFQMEKVMLDV